MCFSRFATFETQSTFFANLASKKKVEGITFSTFLQKSYKKVQKSMKSKNMVLLMWARAGMSADNSCGEKEVIEGKSLLGAAKGIMDFSQQMLREEFSLDIFWRWFRNASAESGCATMCHVGRF
jgi:hypothetical protein